MNLSKSKYTRYCQCPKMLWMDTYKKECAKEDPALQRRFDEGNEAGDLAMGLLGDYVETTAYTADGRLDIPAMLKNTKKYLAQGVENICEAAFSKNRCYCAVDILHKTQEGYDIYEVKSSAELKEVYLIDCAYQKWVLESSGLNIGRVFIRRGDVDIHGLFKIEDVTDRSSQYYAVVKENAAVALEYIAQKDEPQMGPGVHCAKPYPCLYWEYCTLNLPNPNVFDLYRLSASKAEEYYNEGIVTFADVLNAGIKLNKLQRRQVEWEVFNNPTHVDKLGIKAFLVRSPTRCIFWTLSPSRRVYRCMTGSTPTARCPSSILCTISSKRTALRSTKNFWRTKIPTLAAPLPSGWLRTYRRTPARLPTISHSSAWL